MYALPLRRWISLILVKLGPAHSAGYLDDYIRVSRQRAADCRFVLVRRRCIDRGPPLLQQNCQSIPLELHGAQGDRRQRATGHSGSVHKLECRYGGGLAGVTGGRRGRASGGKRHTSDSRA